MVHNEAVSWLSSIFGRARTRATVNKGSRVIDASLVDHLEQFLGSHNGVEAWIESGTTMNQPSLLLVAASGEWTRRPVPSMEWARSFVKRHSIPGYDAGVIPYPQRMRDWDRRQVIEKRRNRYR